MQQRKFERFAVKGNVTFLSDSVQGEGRIENLSLGGAAIASDAPVNKGDYLRLTMTLPNHTAAIDVELAPVRWVNNHGFGVEFIRINQNGVTMLRQFIEHLGLVPNDPAPSNP